MVRLRHRLCERLIGHGTNFFENGLPAGDAPFVIGESYGQRLACDEQAVVGQIYAVVHQNVLDSDHDVAGRKTELQHRGIGLEYRWTAVADTQAKRLRQSPRDFGFRISDFGLGNQFTVPDREFASCACLWLLDLHEKIRRGPA